MDYMDLAVCSLRKAARSLTHSLTHPPTHPTFAHSPHMSECDTTFWKQMYYYGDIKGK